MMLASTTAVFLILLAGWAGAVVSPFQGNSPAPAPSATPEAAPAVPDPGAPASPPAPTVPSTRKKAPQKSAKHRQHAKVKSGSATRKVVRNGGTQEPGVQIAPDMSDDLASQHRQGTAQLLATTDANLKKLDGQQLDSSKQDVVKQIQTYIEQARMAEASGDLDRAHNLAVKAQLLSDDLISH